MNIYKPEGSLIGTPENIAAMKNIHALKESMNTGRILEARVQVCDSEHNLIVDLFGVKGIIPRNEGAIGIEDGSTRDIALISKVNKPVCFKVTEITEDENGNPAAVLSRRKAQEECTENYLSALHSGDIIPAKVTHLEQFGAFVDIGCGIPSLVPIDAISVSRISHPSDRFAVYQDIRVIVKSINDSRIWLSHKELLGTWEENAAQFSCGETVSGIVRSVEDYGVFIELSPNLAGLAEPRDDIRAGQNVSVYIKAIIPEKMKVKLIIVDAFDKITENKPIKYFYEGDHISSWLYSTPQSGRVISSEF
jgi:small subunit ribosomal protein S1